MRERVKARIGSRAAARIRQKHPVGED